MIRVILLAILIAILKTPGALGSEVALGDGVLPLKLPNDGVLPLRLVGEATQGAQRLTTRITLTSATQAPNTGGSLACQISGGNVTKHAATGTILVGLVQYEVKGICYNHDTKKMEVVGARVNGGDRSFMAGTLSDPQPASFAGNLTITGSAPPAGQYQFNVHSTQGGGHDR
jgi:hypothetical protein